MLTCGGVFARYMYCACIHMYSHAHTRYTSIHLQYKCDTCIPGAASRIHAIHVLSAIHHHDTSQYNTVIRIPHMFCGALHFVQQPMKVWGCVECEGNIAGYVCDYKACKAYCTASARTCSRSTTYSTQALQRPAARHWHVQPLQIWSWPGQAA